MTASAGLQALKQAQRERFLAQLRESANVKQSCEKANVSRETMYGWRREDPEFAAAWEDAIADAVDVLEAEAWRRGVEGVEKPVYQGGKKVGTVTEYSDGLLTRLLQAHHPAYKPSIAVDQKTEFTSPLEVVPRYNLSKITPEDRAVVLRVAHRALMDRSEQAPDEDDEEECTAGED